MTAAVVHLTGFVAHPSRNDAGRQLAKRPFARRCCRKARVTNEFEGTNPQPGIEFCHQKQVIWTKLKGDNSRGVARPEVFRRAWHIDKRADHALRGLTACHARRRRRAYFAAFVFRPLIAFDSRDFSRAAALACRMFLDAAWSSFFTVV